MRFRVVLFLCLLVAVASTVVAETPADENLVVSVFPAPLIDGAAPHLYSFERADLDGTGKADTIVAAYSNGIRGTVRLIRAGAVIAETKYPLMFGISPSVRLVDLDGDGKPEIIAAFATMGGGSLTWPLKWKDGALTMVGPSTALPDGNIYTNLGTVEPLDLDGDGRVELLTRTHEKSGVAMHVYKIGIDGKFALQPSKLVYAASMTRKAGLPDVGSTAFKSAPGAPLTIRVANGDMSGTLYLNGRELQFPRDFQKTADGFTVAVNGSDNGMNTLEMKTDGQEGTRMTVTVLPRQ